MFLSKFSLVAFLASVESFTYTPIKSIGVSSTFQGWNDSRLRSTEDSAMFGGVEGEEEVKLPKEHDHDEENPMGGQMFRQMMERAKQQGGNRPSGAQEPTTPAFAPIVPEPAAPAAAPPADAMAYYQQQLKVWQDQMTAYAQLTAANPEIAASMTMPPPPPPPTGMVGGQTAAPVPAAEPVVVEAPKDVDPTTLDPKQFIPKASGNRDAYEITNPADVYFAQLKRDSTVRTEARKRGDLEAANNPFSDPGVKALNNLLSEELIASRREQLAKNGGEFETSRDEMILPYEDDEEEMDKSYTGVSYKQKLLEMKAKKAGQATVAAPTPAPANVSVPEPVAAAPAPVEVAPAEPPAVAESAESKDKEEEDTQKFALGVSEDFDDAPVPAPSAEDTDEARQNIRTTMGLLLKHRGGPGFGHGRLKDAEADKLAASVEATLNLLKSEAGMETTPAPTPAPTPAVVDATVVEPTPAPVVTETPAVSASGAPLTGAITCAEAALAMYKNTDSSAQKDMLIPLRDALTSTINALNGQIEGEPVPVQEAPAAPVYAKTMDFPDTYKVTKPEPEEVVAAPEPAAPVVPEPAAPVATEAPSSSDPNYDSLQKVYDSVKSISGKGKYGLRDLAADEIAHIKDVLMDMRGILMEELNSDDE